MPKTTAKAVSPATSRRLDQRLQQGLALHQAGRLPEAEALYREVLGHASDHTAARHLLGLARLQQGDPATAVELISRAVAQRPDDPQYHCNLGVALNASGQPERAVLSLGRAIELKPDYAEAWSNRGMALKALRRPAEAVENYRQAIALKPREAGFCFNLGNAQTDLGELHEAEASYRRALELRPGYPAALSALALTLEELGRPEEAVATGEAAVTARPETPDYHRALGRAHRKAGRMEDAVASYRRALAIKADDAEVYRLLTELVAHSTRDDDMAAMERLYEKTDAGSEERMHLAYALGRAYDDLGAFPRSLERFTEANAIKRRMWQFSLPQTRRDFQAIQRLFEAPLPQSLLDGGYRDETPIFIVGLPRSGKTSLEAMLARHPRVYGAGELRILAKLASDLVIKHDLTGTDATLASVPAEDFASLGAEYVRYIRSLSPAPSLVVDTMPPNFRMIGFIRLALPNARVINCVRDPFEHCVALFQKHFARRGYQYTCDWDGLTGFYRLYEDFMETWRRALPGFVRDVDFAAVRADPTGEMRALLEFCGLEWDAACAEPGESEPRLGDRRSPEAAAARLATYAPMLSGLTGPRP